VKRDLKRGRYVITFPAGFTPEFVVAAISERMMAMAMTTTTMMMMTTMTISPYSD
jgi:hypothetical protein